MRVELTAEEQQLAREAGHRRYISRLDSPHRWNRPAGDHTEAKEVESTGAEIAVARVLGVPWVEKGRPDPEGDIGEGVQVRHTIYAKGRLLLHADGDRPDNPEHIFYLVTGPFPTYEVVGFISGRRGMTIGVRRELQPGRPCIAVEQHQLEEAT